MMNHDPFDTAALLGHLKELLEPCVQEIGKIIAIAKEYGIPAEKLELPTIFDAFIGCKNDSYEANEKKPKIIIDTSPNIFVPNFCGFYNGAPITIKELDKKEQECHIILDFPNYTLKSREDSSAKQPLDLRDIKKLGPSKTEILKQFLLNPSIAHTVSSIKKMYQSKRPLGECTIHRYIYTIRHELKSGDKDTYIIGRREYIDGQMKYIYRLNPKKNYLVILKKL